MKNPIPPVVAIAFLALALPSCATTEAAPSGPSLLDAIQLSAERLAGDIPAGTRVAIVAFESESDGLSGFIMEELAAGLIDLGIEVVDRRHLGLVLTELDFQMSGYVSDETAMSVGRFLGAEFVVTGQLRNLGSAHRLTSNAIQVETAVRMSAPRFDVRNDAALRDMLAALGGGQVVAVAHGAAGAAPRREQPGPSGASWMWANWSAVSAGGSHTVAIGADGSLWAWGLNGVGQLGDGTADDRGVPVRIGAATNWAAVSAGGGYTVALAADGLLWAWGNNSSGQLGDGTAANRNTPTRIQAGVSWASVSAGSSHTMAIGTDGSLWAWGSGTRGQLGNGRTADSRVPVRVGADYDWAHVSAGDGHTAAVRTDGSLWTWGHNPNGQLGNGTSGARTGRNSPGRVGTDYNWAYVSAGWGHTVAIRADFSLWVWGHNRWGQLGDDTTADRLTPTRIGTAINWAAVSAGREHTVAVGTDGSLWAWGTNMDGRIGDGTATGGGWRNDRHTPTRIGMDMDWASISAGWGHTVAVATDGSPWAWGINNRGQLGIGGVAHSPAQIAGLPHVLLGDR